MKVPLSWLEEFVEIEVEPRRLAEDLTLAGLAVDAVEAHGQEIVLDLDITTNRVDCMNVYGVAREISVLYRTPLRALPASFSEAGPPASEALEVEVEASDLCPRFCARVLDVRLGPSPDWLRQRLELTGVRPINNMVDLTNYVMIEMGHPSHAFDLDRIPGGRLRIRWAREGEALTTLDGVERRLGARAGVVAGPEAPLGLAGIMGGASSEVSTSTRQVALEAAYWDPLSIRRTAKGLGMHTEASHRFERGADPEGPVLATARIAHLAEKIGAGRCRPGFLDRRPGSMPARTATLRLPRLAALLGAAVPGAEARRILEGLGFEVRAAGSEALSVTIPTWRGDVSREADLVEEVARHHGLAKIPSTVPPSRAAGGLKPWQRRERRLRDLLVGAGLTEVMAGALVSESASAAWLPPAVRVENPLSAEQGALRRSLVMPGLLQDLAVNLRQGVRDVAIFEIGTVFMAGPGAPDEERHLGILLAGAVRPAHWSEKARAADLYDLKGLLEAALDRLGAGPASLEPGEVPGFLHPGRSAQVRAGGHVLGWAGALHPDLARQSELRDETLVAELALDGLLTEAPPPVRFQSLPRFPAVARDLSLLSDLGLGAAEVEERVRAAAGPLLHQVAVVDRYDGPPVPAGRLSLTLSLRYQDPERTLTSEEVQASVERVIAALAEAGVEIRGS